MRCHFKSCGIAIACVGLMIILSMVLPTTFWWFLLGLGLIGLGLFLLRRP